MCKPSNYILLTCFVMRLSSNKILITDYAPPKVFKYSQWYIKSAKSVNILPANWSRLVYLPIFPLQNFPTYGTYVGNLSVYLNRINFNYARLRFWLLTPDFDGILTLIKITYSCEILWHSCLHKGTSNSLHDGPA